MKTLFMLTTNSDALNESLERDGVRLFDSEAEAEAHGCVCADAEAEADNDDFEFNVEAVEFDDEDVEHVYTQYDNTTEPFDPRDLIAL